MILAAVLICTKFYNDIYYSNSDFAIVSGITNAEMNSIERYCLDVLDFNLYIDGEEFAKYQNALDLFS